MMKIENIGDDLHQNMYIVLKLKQKISMMK